MIGVWDGIRTTGTPTRQAKRKARCPSSLLKVFSTTNKNPHQSAGVFSLPQA